MQKDSKVPYGILKKSIEVRQLDQHSDSLKESKKSVRIITEKPLTVEPSIEESIIKKSLASEDVKVQEQRPVREGVTKIKVEAKKDIINPLDSQKLDKSLDSQLHDEPIIIPEQKNKKESKLSYSRHMSHLKDNNEASVVDRSVRSEREDDKMKTNLSILKKELDESLVKDDLDINPIGSYFNSPYTPYGSSKPKIEDSPKVSISKPEEKKPTQEIIKELPPMLIKRRMEKFELSDSIEIPLICLNFPVYQGTYGLMYTVVDKSSTMYQVKLNIAKEYQLHPEMIRLFSGGFELPNDVVINLKYSRGEILQYTIFLPQEQLLALKVDVTYEK